MPTSCRIGDPIPCGDTESKGSPNVFLNNIPVALTRQNQYTTATYQEKNAFDDLVNSNAWASPILDDVTPFWNNTTYNIHNILSQIPLSDPNYTNVIDALGIFGHIGSTFVDLITWTDKHYKINDIVNQPIITNHVNIASNLSMNLKRLETTPTLLNTIDGGVHYNNSWFDDMLGTFSGVLTSTYNSMLEEINNLHNLYPEFDNYINNVNSIIPFTHVITDVRNELTVNGDRISSFKDGIFNIINDKTYTITNLVFDGTKTMISFLDSIDTSILNYRIIDANNFTYTIPAHDILALPHTIPAHTIGISSNNYNMIPGFDAKHIIELTGDQTLVFPANSQFIINGNRENGVYTIITVLYDGINTILTVLEEIVNNIQIGDTIVSCSELLSSINNQVSASLVLLEGLAESNISALSVYNNIIKDQIAREQWWWGDLTDDLSFSNYRTILTLADASGWALSLSKYNEFPEVKTLLERIGSQNIINVVNS